MASDSNIDWEDLKARLWSVLKPALVAMIVALLVTLGVPRPGDGVQVQGVSHFSSVYSKDDVEAVDDLIAGDDVTVTDDVTVGGDLAVTGATTAVGLTATGTVQAEQLTSTDDANVTDLITCADLTATDDVVVSDDLLVSDQSDLVGNIGSSTGALTMTDDVNITGALTLDGLVSVGTFARIPAESGIVVTMNGYITPTGTLQAISAAGTVNTSNLAAGTAGDVLIMYNTSAQTINITDTGTIMLSANWAAGQYDTIWLWSDGTNWLEIGRSNN
jgi:hypothetical protein